MIDISIFNFYFSKIPKISGGLKNVSIWDMIYLQSTLEE